MTKANVFSSSHTPSARLSLAPLALAMFGALTAMPLQASEDIPLTLDAARSMARAHQASSFQVGVETRHITGDGTASAKAWNGYEKAHTQAQVDMTLKGGEDRTRWSVMGSSLGSPIPWLDASYGVASQWDVKGHYQRFRHVSNDISILNPGKAATSTETYTAANFDQTLLEQVRDVLSVNGRLFVTPNTTVTAGYQWDRRRGNLSTSAQEQDNYSSYHVSDVSREFLSPVEDQHHQVNVGTEYVFDGLVLGASYDFSKYDNDKSSVFQPVMVSNGDMRFAGKNLDPSSTLNRVSVYGSKALGATTQFSARASYTWLDQDSQSLSFDPMVNTPDLTSLDAQVRLPMVSLALVTRPTDALQLKVDYRFKKYDHDVDGITDEYSGFNYSHYNYTEHKVKGQGILNLGHGYSLKMHGKYIDRNYEEVVDSLKTYQAGIALRKRMSEMFSGSVGYTYTGCDVSDWTLEPYGYPWNLLGFDEHKVDARLVARLHPTFTLTLTGSVYERDYNDDGIPASNLSLKDKEGNVIVTWGDDVWFNGLDKSQGYSLSLDADWAPSRDWNLFAFYTLDYQKQDNTMQGYTVFGYMGPFSSKTQIKMVSHTVGLGLGWHPTNSPWSGTVRYVYGYDKDTNHYNITNWSNDTKSHYANANVTYKVNDRWSVLGVASYGHFSSYDMRRQGWHVDGDPLVDIMMSPNSTNVGVYVGVKYLLP